MTAVKQVESNLWLDSWRKFKRDRPAVLGLVVLSIITLAVVFAPWFYATF
jgi:peptide/nickel transport system permease protein